MTPDLPPDSGSDSDSDSGSDKPSSQPERLGLGQTVSSVLAAFFGVQSSRARRRDFSNGNPLAFVAVALALTALFVLLLLGVVRLIIHLAAAP